MGSKVYKTNLNDDLRPCIYIPHNKKALFHKFIDISHVVEPSIIKGGHTGGVQRRTYALIEFEDGILWEAEIQTCQNKGYGTKAVELINEKYGCKELWVESDNERAIQVYKKNGYEFGEQTVIRMRKE